MRRNALIIGLIFLAVLVAVQACPLPSPAPTPTPVPTLVPTLVPTPTPEPWTPEIEIHVSESQSQSQSQTNTNVVQVNTKVDRTLDIGQVQVYARLVYPDEVLTFPVHMEQKCTIRAAYPVAFYTIGSMYGEAELKVQTLQARPEYDPKFHRMVFGYVPAHNYVNYFTTYATLEVTDGAAFLVLDNRAPGNGYNVVEVTIQE